MSEWIDVQERLPDAEQEVRLFCVTSTGFEYQCQGFYVPPGTYRDDSGYSWDWECCEEYDEAKDDYLVNPGWYESIHNWDDYSAVSIADKVTHWMPIPEAPEKDKEVNLIRILPVYGYPGASIIMGLRMGASSREQQFVFDSKDPPLEDVCKLLSNQLTSFLRQIREGETDA